MAIEHFDVLIVGAGISGIGAGYHLQKKAPDRTFAILEGRERLGGTWDLFRYPGIRSDSDMHTLGYAFEPWTEAKSIADGPAILRYLERTARKYGIDRHIRFNNRVTAASWSTPEARWTVTVERDGETIEMSANFLFMCSGYYDYAAGYTPDFAGLADFPGQVVHPQFWTDNIDHAGKRVVVIGSGATAVTLVPAMAETAAHVTMLQRSPTYIVARPGEDGLANRLRKVLPAKLAYGLTRWKNVLFQLWFFNLARSRPEKVKARLIEEAAKALGPDHDIATHFTPRYNPWDQRLCLIPDADLWTALKGGKASVVTGHIDRFTADGIRLESGAELKADLIVTATGLSLQLMSGIKPVVDGVSVDPSKALNYKGMMLSGLPNLAFSFGYTNASWTLKSDLTGGYVARLLNTMKKRGLRQCTPVLKGDVEAVPFLDFSSGYVVRALEILPKQGATAPWKLHQNYAKDLMALKFGSVDDDAMVFSNPEVRRAGAA